MRASTHLPSSALTIIPAPQTEYLIVSRHCERSDAIPARNNRSFRR
jgi:hypothetical protein